MDETTAASTESTVFETEAATIPSEVIEIPETTVSVSDDVPFTTASVVEIEETVAMTTTPAYLEVIQSSASDIVHADLFGSFLICGTLVGIFLLRGRYGT